MKARFTHINKPYSDFAISRGFYFHETSHMRSFAKMKSSRKFPILKYKPEHEFVSFACLVGLWLSPMYSDGFSQIY